MLKRAGVEFTKGDQPGVRLAKTAAGSAENRASGMVRSFPRMAYRRTRCQMRGR